MSQKSLGEGAAASPTKQDPPAALALASIGESSNTRDQLSVLTPERKPAWHQPHPDEDTVEIEELPAEPARVPPRLPAKKPWGQSQNEQQTRMNSDGRQGSDVPVEDLRSSAANSGSSFNTAADARRNNRQQPKPTNVSLLSSAVAHATLERCLLGVNGGEITEEAKEFPSSGDDIIDYSRQCKPGHVIDILELRRLSSRGVPDKPPEARTRSVSAPAAVAPALGSSRALPPPPPPYLPLEKSSGGSSSSDWNSPHRSYRPLVWRVLLGYLPPPTSLWNEVLSRDRRLYATLVQELFSCTCPAPHDVYDEEELQAMRMRRGESKQIDLKERSGGENLAIYDENGEEGIGAHVFAKEGSTASVVTPGLLSARMQQEWVRGMEQGKESIYTSPGNDCITSPGGWGNGSLARISPMCAMNTPRTKIRKEAFKGVPEDGVIEEVENSNSFGNENTLSSLKNEDHLASQLKESLLIPNDVDEENEDVDGQLDTIHVGEVGVNGENEGTADGWSNKTLSDSADIKLTRSISITKTSSEDYSEGVEICRQSSQDDDDGVAITPAPGTYTTDEEENILLLDEIRKDVIRTHPDLRFFLEPNEDLGQKRYAALERILFVWAKLNKGVRYVQGMNEIVGTLYFVLAHDSNEDWAKEAEADTYFLFNSLMVEMRDVFVPDLDEADTGIHGRISNMITLLSLHDPEVRCHLDSVGIDPSFYSVRWLTTLLSREFLLPDTIRLWDSMFASTHKDNFLRYVSVSMVMVIRDQLLSGDFSACLRLLQAYPPTNLDRLLESSRALWIYESQITLACHKGGISLGHALRSIAPPPAIIMAYGLPGGVAPPITLTLVGERGLRAARGAANGASSTVVGAGRSFLGSAMSFWRTGNGNGGEEREKEVRRSKSTST